MIRARTLVLVLAMAASTVSACTSSTEPGLADRLQGEWSWVSASGGIAGINITPASTGESMSLRFFASDSVELRRAGVLIAATRYSLGVASDGSGDEIRYDQPLMGFETQRVDLPAADSLVLGDPCCDGFTYVFVRTDRP